MTMYCLEILRKIEDVDEMRARDGIFEHVGYEHRVDRRRACPFSDSHQEAAAEYYGEQPRYARAQRARHLAKRLGRGDETAYAVREDHQVVAQ